DGTTTANAKKQMTAFAAFLREGGKSQSAPADWMAASSAEYQQKSMSIGSDPDGGYAVPETLEGDIKRRLTELSPVRQFCRVVEVTTAPSSYKIPISRGGVASGWAGEATTRTVTAAPTLAMPSFPDAEIWAMPQLSNGALDDIANLAAFISESVAEEFALQEGTAALTGNGTNKLSGILRNSPVATDDGASPERNDFTLEFVPLAPGASPSGVITADGLIDLQHGLRSGYWGKAVFCMNRSTLGKIRKLKATGTGDYIWTQPLAAGQPSTLLGYPVAIMDSLASVTLNSLPVLFADWSRLYCILERPTKLLIDPYSTKGQTLLYFSKRESGHMVDSYAGKVGKCVAA
ncbi:MAG: phage major capsid protein, partial [Gammaproteobacteria bacterium]|nr:phage major capsid protein [Gammaproteobacteria bacterium]